MPFGARMQGLQVSPLPNSGASVDGRRKPLVLVVDPDSSARSVLEVVLVRDGFDVWSTGSGVEGLTLLAKRTPDVIVLESDLGGEDGFSFVSQIRGELRTAHVPVLLLARPDDENVSDLAEVVGVDDYVRKPAFARDISALVRLELAKNKGSKEVVFQSGQLSPAHLLRALLSCPRSGRLVLAGGRGKVEFRDGRVVDARFGQVWGIDALVRSLVLTHGEWKLSLEPVEQGNVFHCSLREFVQVVLPRVHAWDHMLLRSVPLDSRQAVDFFRLSKSLASMPDDVNRIVQLFDGQRTVRQVLLDSPFEETMTLEVATRLYLMGVIVPLKDDPSRPIVPKAAPKLFEPVTGAEGALVASAAAAPLGHQQPHEDDLSFAFDDDAFADTPAPRDSAPAASADEGWKTAALDSPELAELAPDVAQQIEAFNIRIEVEPREVKRPSPQLSARPNAAPAPVVVPTVVAKAPIEAKAPVEVDEPLVPVAKHFDRQQRIVTPTLTPAAVDPLEASFFGTGDDDITPIATPRSLLVGSPSPSVAPVQAKPVEVAEKAKAAAAVVEAKVEAPAADEVDERTLTRKSPTLFIGVGVAVLVLAIAVEMLVIKPTVSSPEPERAPVAPPPAPAVVAAPVLPDIEEPEFIEDEAPATVIDVSSPLRDAKAKYELGLYAQAIAMLEQVVADEPKSVQGWLLLGLARYDFNNAKGAKEAAAKVLELEPNNAGVQMLLATLSFDSGDKVAAKEALQKYLTLAPNGPSADEARALLAR